MLNKKITSEPAVILLSLIFIALAGFAVYINSLNGEFFWDDYHLIRYNTQITNWDNLTRIFTSDMGQGSTSRYNYYRPLQTLIFMTEYRLWGLDVRGYHTVNILFHILTALCLYWLSFILFKNKQLSFIAGILFAVHPVHTEAVAYISGLAGPLVASTTILCVIFYIKTLKKPAATTYFLSIIFFILALLSKENSVMLPVLLAIYHYAFRERVRFKYFSPLILLAFIYVVLRITLLKSIAIYPSWLASCWQRIPGVFVSITNYLKLLVLPLGLHMDYGKLLFYFNDARAISGIIFSISCVLYIVKRRENKLLSFSILWFFATLLPVSSIYPLAFYMAEHFLYLPSLGFFLILAKALSSERIKTLGKLLSLTIIIFYALLTMQQNVYWQNPIAFYKNSLKYTPRSIKLHNNLGQEYAALGEFEKAIDCFKKVIKINPDIAEPYNNIGAMYVKTNKPEQAITYYKKAIELDRNNYIINYNLAKAYSLTGKTDDAICWYKKTLDINPSFYPAHKDLAFIYHELKMRDLALKHINKAIELGGEIPPESLELINEKK